MYVWQSRVEIEGYSVVYFDRLLCLKRRIAELPVSNEFTKCIWAQPLPEVQQYGASKAAMRLKNTTE